MPIQLEALAQSIRDAGHLAQAYPADARDEEEMVAMVEAIERDVGPIEVAVFNIGANVNFSVTDTTRASLSQGMGNGGFCRLPDGPRGGKAHG